MPGPKPALTDDEFLALVDRYGKNWKVIADQTGFTPRVIRGKASSLNIRSGATRGQVRASEIEFFAAAKKFFAEWDAIMSLSDEENSISSWHRYEQILVWHLAPELGLTRDGVHDRLAAFRNQGKIPSLLPEGELLPPRIYLRLLEIAIDAEARVSEIKAAPPVQIDPVLIDSDVRILLESIGATLKKYGGKPGAEFAGLIDGFLGPAHNLGNDLEGGRDTRKSALKTHLALVEWHDRGKRLLEVTQKAQAKKARV
jgi:hypothetical protein